METSPAPDVLPSPTPSSKGFKSVIAKAKLISRDDSPSVVLPDTEDGVERNGMRNSIDSLVRRSTRSSVDDGLPAGPSNMSKLIPGRVKKKKKIREEAERLLREEEKARGRSQGDQIATSATVDQTPTLSKSQSSLSEDEGNSLITIDSNTES